MSKRKDISTWVEITSIINAEDSELEEGDDDEIYENINCFMHEESLSNGEIDLAVAKSTTKLMDTIMQNGIRFDNDIEKQNLTLEIENESEKGVVIPKDIEIDFMDENLSYNVTSKDNIKWRKRVFDQESSVFAPALVTPTHIRTPYEIFKEYIPEKLIHDMAKFTNMYGLQKVTDFKQTNPDEIMKLLGMHILMGVIKLPQIKLYWSNNLNINSISSVMTRDRFFLLRTNLHLIDNNIIHTNCDDKLIKVRPLINAVRNRCLKVPVEEVVSIDEQMIPLKSHFNVNQNIDKNKSKPLGIKVFFLAGKSGYPYDFVINERSNTKTSMFDKTTFGFGSATVLHLSSRLVEPGHQLYFDDDFSSYQLFEILKERKINATGTIKINQFNKPAFSSDLVLKNKGRGSSEELTSSDGKIVIVKWQVCVILNCDKLNTIT